MVMAFSFCLYDFSIKKILYQQLNNFYQEIEFLMNAGVVYLI